MGYVMQLGALPAGVMGRTEVTLLPTTLVTTPWLRFTRRGILADELPRKPMVRAIVGVICC